jgi:hypothetical protein
MRRLLLSLLLSPLIRTTTCTSFRRTIPSLEYPVCRKTFTCAAPSLKLDFRTMADLSKEQQEEVERLAKPAVPCEGEILGKNEGREEALKEVEVAKEEEALPKLSAAEFRVYNSMAEHMDLFVSSPLVYIDGRQRLTECEIA